MYWTSCSGLAKAASGVYRLPFWIHPFCRFTFWHVKHCLWPIPRYYFERTKTPYVMTKDTCGSTWSLGDISKTGRVDPSSTVSAILAISASKKLIQNDANMICAILCPRRCHTIGIANATRVLLHQLGPQLPNTTRFSLPMSANSTKETQNQTQRLGMIRDQSVAKVIKHLTPGARTTDAPRSTAIQRFLQCPSSAELLPERNEETKAGN